MTDFPPPTRPPAPAETATAAAAAVPPPTSTGLPPAPAGLPPAPGPSARPTDATVHLESISKAFGQLVAVSEVSFSVGQGVTALLGPNGAGKSTLLRVMAGLTAPSTGSVWVAGGDPRNNAAARAQIGLVPQQDGVFERDTVEQFVELSAVLNGVPDVRSAVDSALTAVELPADLTRPIGTFSKGMRQRAKIAAALVHNPSVLFLDEPLNGLDPKQRRQMISLFHSLGDQGRTVIVSSHVLEEVERFGSRVLVIAKGRLAAQGDFRDIRNLMNDQPMRYRIRCTENRQVAAALVGGSLVTGCTIPDSGTIEVTTDDVSTFRRQLAFVCRHYNSRLEEVTPLDDDLESVFRYLVGPG